MQMEDVQAEASIPIVPPPMFDQTSRSKVQTFDDLTTYDDLLPSSSDELPELRFGGMSCLRELSMDVHYVEPSCGYDSKEVCPPQSPQTPPQFHFLPMYPHTTLLELYMDIVFFNYFFASFLHKRW
jgi:hypothetical protein